MIEIAHFCVRSMSFLTLLFLDEIFWSCKDFSAKHVSKTKCSRIFRKFEQFRVEQVCRLVSNDKHQINTKCLNLRGNKKWPPIWRTVFSDEVFLYDYIWYQIANVKKYRRIDRCSTECVLKYCPGREMFLSANFVYTQHNHL